MAAGSGGLVRPAEALAGGDRDERQDDHDVDAARHAARRGAALGALRQHRQPGDRHARRARRGARGGTVEFSAALGAVAATGRGSRAQRRRGSPRLARFDGRVRGRQGAGAGGPGGRRGARRPRRGETPRPLRRAGSGRVQARRTGGGGAWGRGRRADRQGLRRRAGARRHLVDPCAGSGRCAQRVGRRCAGTRGRRARRSHRRCAVVISPRPAPCREGRRSRRRDLCRRLQGHQPACGARVHRGVPAGGVDRRRPPEGCVGRRTRLRSIESPGRRRVDRPGPGAGRQRVIATRPGCTRRGGCDGGGFCGA